MAALLGFFDLFFFLFGFFLADDDSPDMVNLVDYHFVQSGPCVAIIWTLSGWRPRQNPAAKILFTEVQFQMLAVFNGNLRIPERIGTNLRT